MKLLRAACLMIPLAGLMACTAEPGSEAWCETKKSEKKSEWSMDDAATYARNCVIDGTAVGSEKWCEDLKETPKSQWTAEDASAYAKHCVI